MNVNAPATKADIPAALFAAQGFILGFEDDPEQDGIGDLLKLIEKAQDAARGQITLKGGYDRWGDFINYQSGDRTLTGWYQAPARYDRSDHGLWHGVETFHGVTGKQFTRLTHAVIDDFGDLVEVSR